MNIPAVEQEAKQATYDFYYTNKKAPRENRSQLADDFLAEWASKVDVIKPMMTHPETRRKEFLSKYSIADILADFILNADIEAEKTEEYPVENPDKRVNGDRKREKKERHLVLDGELDDEEEDEPLPPYSVLEHDFNSEDPFEALFTESTAYQVEELTSLIEQTKRERSQTVQAYTDPSRPWNEETPNKYRTAKNVSRAIRELNIFRVRKCVVCGGAFYAHDWRRQTCDLQRSKAGATPSQCEVIYHRKYEKGEYLGKENSIS